jgi:hypothetical protein
MSAKNPVGDKATTVVADNWEETLKRIGGSQSDDWNHVLGNQAIQFNRSGSSSPITKCERGNTTRLSRG